MALNDYAALKASIADWANRTDLPVEDLITLAESRIRKHPDFHDDFISQAPEDPAILIPDQDYLVPDRTYGNWTAIEEVWYDDATYRGKIEIVPPHVLSEKKRQFATTTGRPMWAAVYQFWGEQGGGDLYHKTMRLKLAPTPDTYYTVYLSGSRELTALSESASVNWLLYNHPDVYLFGALAEAEPYLKNDTRSEVWNAKFEDAMRKLGKQFEHRQFAGAVTMPQQAGLGG